MAWNRSKVENGKRRVENGGKSAILNPRFVVPAVVILAVTGSVAWWAFRAREETTRPADGRRTPPSMIAEAKPNITTNVVVEAPKEEVVMKRDRNGNLRQWKRPETYRDDKGTLRYKAGGARAPEVDEFKNAVRIDTPSNIPRFKHHVEHEIATLLTVEPGGMLIGAPHYDRRFEEDFLRSLTDPVKIEEDDSEADRQLKQEVEATKKELAERIKAGENLADIFTETRDEIMRLAAVKQDIMALAREATANPDMSDADVKAYYDAVNRLLEQKGIAPVGVGGLMKRRAMHQAKTASTTNE